MYWAHALSSNAIEQLFFVAPVAGYYLLNANIQTFLAALVPLSVSPFVTIFSSALITFIPIFFLKKYSFSEKNSLSSFVGSLTFIVIPVFSIREIALNSINSQIFLAMGVIILISAQPQVSGLREKIFLNLFLILSFFSGWYSLVFIPIAILKVYFGHSSRINRQILFWGGLGSVVQVIALLHSLKNKMIWPGRFQKQFSGDLVTSFLIEIFNFSLFGFQSVSFNLVIVFYALFGLFFFWNLARGNYSSKNMYEILYLLLAFLLLFIFILVGQTAQYMEGRYIALPSFIIFLTLVKICQTQKYNFLSLSFSFCLIVIYLFSIIFVTQKPYCEIECRKWSLALQTFEESGTRLVYHWPITVEKNWFTDLNNPKVQLSPFQKIGLEK